jgi:hypothetical protein
MRRSFALLIALLATLAAAQSAPTTTAPPQNSQVAAVCGKDLPLFSTLMPDIGCFGVPTGGTSRGTFDGHQFVVTIDAGGKPICRSDGSVVECNGCVGPESSECPVRLMVLSHNPDKSVSFTVMRRTDGDRYVFRIDQWDRYKQLRNTREEVERAQGATAALSPPPAAMSAPPAPSPVSPSEPGTGPAAADPTDGPAAFTVIGWQAQRAYGSGEFAKLEALVENLSHPHQLTDSGLPRLRGVYDGLWDFLSAWKDWQNELDKVAGWRKLYPDSRAADLVEAMVWSAWAWDTRGTGYASTVTPEGWKLFEARISRAGEVLDRSKNRASRSPLWYQLRLGVARDAGWDHKRYQALFEEATQRFPWYIPLYFWATDYLSPKWGGSYEEIDAFARRTAILPLGTDYSLYTRIYWSLTGGEPLEFEPFRDSLATWPLMKRGFEGLMKRYPNSKWNLNAFASFACRADDRVTYGALRARIGKDVMPGAWASNHSTEVCDERLLGHT